MTVKQLEIHFEKRDALPNPRGGFRPGGVPKWAQLYRAIQSLEPDGPVIRIPLANKHEAELARAAANNMATRSDGRTHINSDYALPAGVRVTTRVQAIDDKHGTYELWAALVTDDA